jgi:hypothetical protein
VRRRGKNPKRGTKTRPKKTDPLEQACGEFRRPDLFSVLGRAIILNPRLAKRYFDRVLEAKRYRTAGCVMLYDHKMKEARRYFEMALKRENGDAARARLKKILKEFPTVAKIAQRSWKIAGKYKKKERELSWRHRKRA